MVELDFGNVRAVTLTDHMRHFHIQWSRIPIYTNFTLVRCRSDQSLVMVPISMVYVRAIHAFFPNALGVPGQHTAVCDPLSIFVSEI